jgi:hypothetical protein
MVGKSERKVEYAELYEESVRKKERGEENPEGEEEGERRGEPRPGRQHEHLGVLRHSISGSFTKILVPYIELDRDF